MQYDTQYDMICSIILYYMHYDMICNIIFICNMIWYAIWYRMQYDMIRHLPVQTNIHYHIPPYYTRCSPAEAYTLRIKGGTTVVSYCTCCLFQIHIPRTGTINQYDIISGRAAKLMRLILSAIDRSRYIELYKSNCHRVVWSTETKWPTIIPGWCHGWNVETTIRWSVSDSATQWWRASKRNIPEAKKKKVKN